MSQSFSPDRPPSTSTDVRPKRLGSLLSAGREALAFAKLATLLHKDTLEIVPAEARPGDDVVVMLHGLFATAGVLRPLRESIREETGAHIASFTYAPGPGVDRVARRLGELVARFPEHVRIHLVGHSLGGIVVRWYVEALEGDPRVAQTISIAAPFAGTPRARLLPGGAGEDISPESPVLRRLAKGPRRGVPHVSITGTDDDVVGSGGKLPDSDHLVIVGCGHNGLLYDPRTADEVVRRVRSASAARR